jgi:hemerythrin
MPVVAWDENFCVGVAQLDKEHKYLVDLINSFYDACAKKSPIECLDVFLKELVDYASYHFESEELMMRELGYVEFTEHKKRHAFFVKTVVEMKTEFEEERKDISVVTLTFLIHWMRHHIQFEDTEFGRFATQNVSTRVPKPDRDGLRTTTC